jgi:flagellar basal-body rod protein FlgB
VLDSVTMNAMSSALDGYASAQTVIANNIANINTPGFRAQEVDFSAVLAKSVAAGSGRLPASAIAPTPSLDPPGVNGNNVSLQQETVTEISNGIRFQAASQAITQQFSELRAAATVA